MQQPTPQERLSAYRQWRTSVAGAIKDLDDWLKENHRATDETHACVQAALAAVHSSDFRVAFLSGIGVDRSALIDALFLHDDERSLSPVPAGNDTCPTEIFWDDERGEAYLRLLPIETLGQDRPLADLRADPTPWVDRPLDGRDPQQMASCLREIGQTKVVGSNEAHRLGLAPIGATGDADHNEIPRWRHAIISLPSPTLRLGLRLLEVPPLAASQSAYDLLAQAQVAVCVLAADQEQGAADIERWRHQLRTLGSASLKGTLVALDNVNGLWAKGKDAIATQQQITQRRFHTAAALGLEAAQVLPVSAKQALAARAQGDRELMRRTGIEALGTEIWSRLYRAGYEAHLSGLDAGLSEILESNRARLAAQIELARTRRTEFEDYRDKSDVLIAQLLDKTRQEQEVYLRGVQRFQISREALIIETKRCRDMLDPDNIEALIAQTHTQMLRSWTTAGMAAAMKNLFEELRRAMQAIATESERIRRLVRETYETFQGDFGCELPPPKVFVPMKFRVEIELLYQEVDAFRRSPALALAEQSSAIKRFHEEIVTRARVLFDQLRAAFDTWIHDTLQPLAEHIQEHKVVMERRLDNLRRLGHSKDEANRHIQEAHAQYVELARQLTNLRNISNTLRQDPAREFRGSARPPAAAQRP